MSEKKRGVLITGPDGTVYHLTDSDLSKFKVSPEKLEQTIKEAEALGFFGITPEDYASCTGSSPEETLGQIPQVADHRDRPVINIFIGTGTPPPEQGTIAITETPPSPGSTMSKYAAGSTMSKYAAGSTMSKYAAGSTMSKYAAGSTMSKYAAGSTIPIHEARTSGLPAGKGGVTTTFYGDWPQESEKEKG